MTRIVPERTLYRTGDVALAAVICLWYPLDAIERHADGPVFFVFRWAVDLDSVLEDYWRGVIRVEPQAYCQHIHLLQRRVWKETASR